MNIDSINNVYFVGIGGIGMSSIARYFNSIGKNVAGYDRVKKELTNKLISEGIDIHFEDNVDLIDKKYKNSDSTLVVYTPAIPNTNKELSYFATNEFVVKKRSEVLGLLCNSKQGIAIAGTHGKTTISTMIAHLLKQSDIGCSAFLGGISKNFNSNYLVDIDSKKIVIEADEFDRSFLTLFPDIAVISSIDADHLDIYENADNLKKSFEQFANQINNNGKLIIKKGLEINLLKVKEIDVYYYSLKEKADFYAENIKIENGLYIFDFITPDSRIDNIRLGLAGIINVENAIAALSIAYLSGVESTDMKKALASFNGILRRFDYQIRNKNFVYIDDYAHHPIELKAIINSVREIYYDKKITGVFQPHLYSRTRDFVDEFAESLDLLDEIILLDIYPAREMPINGISSKIIFDKLKTKNKILCKKDELLNILKIKNPEVLLTLGAGDIDEFVEPIKKLFI
ncbi:MAG: UDP-N-acetylmuramate--L-alanine ligase [Bacteroidales bacterium]|nr:UDP-N-acetylmuramate--L-alanine ligase [Bacteroidales bacterium]